MSSPTNRLTTVPNHLKLDNEQLGLPKRLSLEEPSKLPPVVRLILIILSVLTTILSFWVLLKEALTPHSL
jgi:hypothetical protein